ncbi:cytochrome c3 family protein [Trichloromonas sp.]|uniref:cytochrome c3 family protein n=1 Tax=Trichloromonas sp. TaxID=3069249 RepID=UPI003D81BDDF
MKKLLVAAMLVAFAATAALATDTVVMEAKNGNVTFNHKTHADQLGCEACHQGEPAMIELDKNSAHALCKDCHKAQSGPTKCGDCHKK